MVRCIYPISGQGNGTVDGEGGGGRGNLLEDRRGPNSLRPNWNAPCPLFGRSTGKLWPGEKRTCKPQGKYDMAWRSTFNEVIVSNDPFRSIFLRTYRALRCVQTFSLPLTWLSWRLPCALAVCPHLLGIVSAWSGATLQPAKDIGLLLRIAAGALHKTFLPACLASNQIYFDLERGAAKRSADRRPLFLYRAPWSGQIAFHTKPTALLCKVQRHTHNGN